MIGQNGSSGEPTHSGSWDAWLDGYGTTHTDTLSQSVTIPSGCSNYTLSFWLHIDTSETTTTTAYDKLTVTLGSTTLATYSNLNKASGYVQHSFNVVRLRRPDGHAHVQGRGGQLAPDVVRHRRHGAERQLTQKERRGASKEAPRSQTR